MADSITHHVQHHSTWYPLSPHNRQIRLSLPTQSYVQFTFLTAQTLRERLVLDKYLKHEETEICVKRRPRTPVCMLEHIARQREVRAEGGW